MSRRTASIRLIITAVAIALLAVVGIVALQPHKPLPTSKTTQAAPSVVTTKPINRGLPTQLKIPRLGIEAPVGYVGLTKSGAMDAPKDVAEAGWYKYGPLPGNTGSAVIAGHITGQRGVPGVFSKLDAMQVGDIFSVVDSTGQSTRFTVRQIRTYDQDEQPTEVFTSTSGAHLNLISCAGEWDSAQRHYLKRLVVFSDKTT